jgi:hypothetical protein
MDDNWIREPGDPEDARPVEGDPARDAPPGEDPQAGLVTRDAEDVPESAQPLHPDVGGPFGPS